MLHERPFPFRAQLDQDGANCEVSGQGIEGQLLHLGKHLGNCDAGSDHRHAFSLKLRLKYPVRRAQPCVGALEDNQPAQFPIRIHSPRFLLFPLLHGKRDKLLLVPRAEIVRELAPEASAPAPDAR